MQFEVKKGDLVHPKEVAEVLSVTRAHVYNLVRRGKLKAIHSGRAVRIFRSSLQEYIKRMEFKPYV